MLVEQSYFIFIESRPTLFDEITIYNCLLLLIFEVKTKCKHTRFIKLVCSTPYYPFV